MIADRFTMLEDVEWFDQALAKLVEEELVEEPKNIGDYGLDTYFVDFLRDAPEATGTHQSKRHSTGTFQQCCCLFKGICFGIVIILMSNFLSSQGKSQKIQTLIYPKCTNLLSHLRA